MATITETTLVKVKTISKKYLTQVQIVPYDWNEGSLHRQLYTGLLDGTVTALGWMRFGERNRLWLVRRTSGRVAELFQFMPPSHGVVNDHWEPTLEQLFVD